MAFYEWFISLHFGHKNHLENHNYPAQIKVFCSPEKSTSDINFHCAIFMTFHRERRARMRHIAQIRLIIALLLQFNGIYSKVMTFNVYNSNNRKKVEFVTTFNLVLSWKWTLKIGANKLKIGQKSCKNSPWNTYETELKLIEK